MGGHKLRNGTQTQGNEEAVSKPWRDWSLTESDVRYYDFVEKPQNRWQGDKKWLKSDFLTRPLRNLALMDPNPVFVHWQNQPLSINELNCRWGALALWFHSVPSLWVIRKPYDNLNRRPRSTLEFAATYSQRLITIFSKVAPTRNQSHPFRWRMLHMHGIHAICIYEDFFTDHSSGGTASFTTNQPSSASSRSPAAHWRQRLGIRVLSPTKWKFFSLWSYVCVPFASCKSSLALALTTHHSFRGQEKEHLLTTSLVYLRTLNEQHC